MPTFLYKGFGLNDQKISGCKSFSDKTLMEKYLKDSQIDDFEIFESQTIFTKKNYKLVNSKEISIFCKEMSVLFFSDITLMEGIDLISSQTSNKELKKTLLEIKELMLNGYTFAESISMYENIFSPYFINMVAIGEMSGTLDEVFEELGTYYEKESKLNKKIKSAVVYPIVLIIMMTCIIALLILKILPMFNDILLTMGSEMPPLTKMMLNLNTIFINNWIFFVFVIIILVLLFSYYRRTTKGRLSIDKAKVLLPVSKYVFSRVIVSRVSRSLSILLRSGVNILTGFNEVILLTENKFLESQFIIAMKRLESGKSLSEALDEIKIFPPLFIKMIVIGERTGKLDEMLQKASIIFDEEVDDAVSRVTSLIEPVLIIILSVIIGIILLSLMLPMIRIMTTIG